jgi:hypothetical protein
MQQRKTMRNKSEQQYTKRIDHDSNEPHPMNTESTSIDVAPRRNEFPVKKFDSYCLIISSCFFLLPGAFGILYQLYLYSIVSAINPIRRGEAIQRTSNRDAITVAQLVITVVQYHYPLMRCAFIAINNIAV